MDNDLRYELSPEFLNYIGHAYQDMSYKIVELFETLDGLNQYYHNHNKIFLDKLEARCINIINRSQSEDEAITGIEIYLKRAVEHYLTIYGIELYTEDISIFTIGSILEGLLCVYKIDIPGAEDLLITIDSDDIDNIERFSYIVSQFCTIGESFIFESVQSVGDLWFEHIGSYLRAKVHRGTNDVNVNDIVKVQPLLSIDPVFNTTDIIKEILYYGHIEYLFNSKVDSLYNSIDRHLDDYKLIAMEIVATNYMSIDKPIVNENSLLEIINFKALAHVDFKTALDKIVPMILHYNQQLQGN